MSIKRILDRLPESISALSTKRSTLWTLCMWLATIVALLTLSLHNEQYQTIAFLSCACLGMVGIMPLIEGKHNTLHNIFGVSACLLNQAWVGLVYSWEFLIVWWVLYAILLYFAKSKWCFVAEIWCVLSTIFALCN